MNAAAPLPDFAATLAADRTLPASRTTSSEHLGWTSALVRTYRENPSTGAVDLPPVEHPALVMVTGGVYRIESRGSGRWLRTVYRGGSIGLTPPGRGNTLRWHALSPEPLTSVHVHLARPVWDEVAERTGGAKPSAFPNRLADGDPLVASLLRALAWAAATAAPALYVDATVQLLCTHLALRPGETASASDRPVRGLSTAALAAVVSHMDQHLGQDITLEALAAEAGSSKYHFLRQFKATTGSTPIAFLTGLRMQRAAVMLADGRRSIDWIAYACGYRSVSRFSAAFRRHHGVSPARYRDTR